jgi:hypothetical protein
MNENHANKSRFVDGWMKNHATLGSSMDKFV